MSGIKTVLRESFEMLFEKPKLFIPRLFSASVSSLMIIGWFTGFLTTKQFVVSFPFVAVIGAFTPVIVSSMVESKDEEDALRKALTDSVKLWKQVVGLTLLTMFLAFLNSLPLSLGLMLTYMTGNSLYLFTGGLISLLILLGISFGLYFVPINLVKDRKLFVALQNAFSTSNRNRREVITLTLFSLAVLLASSTVTGRLRNIGLTVFFLGRMVSSVVGTYLLVVSPQFYLSQEEMK